MSEETKELCPIEAQLANQHPFHAMLGRVFQKFGGEERVVQWADENPGAYIRLMMGTTPSMQPMQHIQGDVNLHVHATLGPTALDGSIVDEQ